MIVAESVGFAATHSLTEILRGLPGYEVAHGSRHFEAKTPIGQDTQTPEEFVAAMQASAEAGNRPVALHTLMPPHQLKSACEAAGADYWLLVRNPVDQVDSCFAWATARVMEGNSGAFLQVVNESLADLVNKGIEATLPNCLYTFALKHVLGYNFFALGLGTSFHKTEDLLADEAAFRTAFAVPEEAEIAHFNGGSVHRRSHRAESPARHMADPDRETLRANIAVRLSERDYSIQDMNLLLGY
ncbi:hypothetical protein GCM10011360_29010 [Primorskyibacter flagellatus]|uniref:Uncharacterized protein n=1 Tax=Primorskyibacter flagellatus TaxID=1387277 RepID=A0A917AC74_9RHOB|nr:hypothetical protein [Primorskyibacter flagellatus]GGE39545.1 hypothetical protein GCM10011360_29010 [Primorskyibacter flagellatus]